jgi:hypothetical protein
MVIDVVEGGPESTAGALSGATNVPPPSAAAPPASSSKPVVFDPPQAMPATAPTTEVPTTKERSARLMVAL